MKTKTEKYWLKSIVINTAIMVAVLVFTKLMYETNDDFSIAAKISEGYPYIGFVNYYICKVLIAIQRILPNVNIFILSQLVASFISFVVIDKIIFERSKSRGLDFVTIAATVIFSLDHYSSVQFTKTSAILMVAGLLLVVDTYINNRRITSYTLGFLLFYVGVAYRQKGMFPALAFAAVFMLIWIALNRRTMREWMKRGTKEIATILLLTIVALIPYGIDMMSDAANASTQELKAARTYQAERVKVTDYPVYKYYDENKEKYDQVGLSENDIFLVSHWMLDYKGAASYDNLKAINAINQPCIIKSRSAKKATKKFIKSVYKSIQRLDFNGIHIVTIFFISVYFLLMSRPKNWTYLLGTGIVTAGIYIALYYLQRPQYRAFYVADLGAVVWLLYAACQDGKERPDTNKKKGIIGILCSVMVLSLLVPAAQNLQAQYDKICNKTESDAWVQYYQQNNDKFYVCSTSSKKRHPSYMHPLQIPVVEKNATGQGGWGTMSIYETEQLESYGLNDVVGDLINKENVYFVGDTNLTRLTEYYNKWYAHENNKIVFVKYNEVEGTNIYKIIEEPIYG